MVIAMIMAVGVPVIVMEMGVSMVAIMVMAMIVIMAIVPVFAAMVVMVVAIAIAVLVPKTTMQVCHIMVVGLAPVTKRHVEVTGANARLGHGRHAHLELVRNGQA